MNRSPQTDGALLGTSLPSDDPAVWVALVNGEPCPATEAKISVLDDGFVRGDGAFEVVRIYSGCPFALREHMARLEYSCAVLRLPCEIAVIEAEAEQLVGYARGATCDLRIILTRGGARLLLLEPPRRYRASLRLAFVEYAPTTTLAGAKTLSYAGNMLATRLAAERGFDDALLVAPSGHVLEAPTASFFWATDTAVFTPPLDGILASITRAKIIDALRVEERACSRADAMACREAFVASTTREIHAVTGIQKRALANVPGPFTVQARATFDELVQATLRCRPGTPDGVCAKESG